MKKDLNYYAHEFADGLLEQQKAIWDSRDRAYIRKQEKRWSTAVDRLLELDEGLGLLTKLLDHDSPKVSITAAVYLLDTSAEMKAVEVLKRHASRPEDDLYAYAAQERLKDWKKQKKKKH